MKKLIDNLTLTANFQDKIESINSRGGSLLYVKYDKGTETGMVMTVQFSPDGDTEGAEDWHTEANIDNAGAVTEKVNYTFANSGKYRIQIPASAGDDKIKVSVKAAGGTPTGTVTVLAQI